MKHDSTFWVCMFICIAVDLHSVTSFVRRALRGKVTGGAILYLAFQLTLTMYLVLA